MRKQGIILYIFLILSVSKAYSQEQKLSAPELEFDGSKLTIGYDLTSNNPSDLFYVWIALERENGEALDVRAISGDIGDTEPGKGKRIIWKPADDSVFVDENISVEVHAERYVKEFNKGSAMMKSVIFPGLGQTKMRQGKPYWIMGVAFYGSLAGGLVTYSGYKSNYDKYLTEETDPQKRADYLDKAEKNAAMSSALLVTAAVLWTSNLIWAGATPNRYQPLKHKPLTLQPSADPLGRSASLTLRYKF